MVKARIFRSGRSQCVLLPKKYRLEGAEVRIRRPGNAVVLEPIADHLRWLGTMGDDFLPDGREQPPMPPDRPELDDLFR